MLIRAEEHNDRAAVHAVNAAAFDTEAEANLVDALRARAQPCISLVAEEHNAVVGHIMFSPITLANRPELRIMGLAPMAVTPSRQRSGVGSALVRAGLEQCRRLGFGAVVVLGHPAFYPRFGFSRADQFGLASEYESPPEAFMAIELAPHYLDDVAGTVKYHEAFGELGAGSH